MSSMQRTIARAQARKNFLGFYIRNRGKLVVTDSVWGLVSALVLKIVRGNALSRV